MDHNRQHILITGGSGFLGRAIVSAFLTEYPSHTYTVLDISPTPPSTSHPNLTYIRTDIRDADAVERAFSSARPTAVVHSAGIVPAGAARYTQRERDHVFSVNVEGTRNVLKAAKAVGTARAFVYTSSSTVVGDDLSRERPNAREEIEDVRVRRWVYGESKTHAEHLVLTANDPHPTHPFLTTCLRPSVLFGPGDVNLIPAIHALTTTPLATTITLGTGLNLYDFTYVTNAADAHVLATRNLLSVQSDSSSSSLSAAGSPIFITNAQPVPFRDFCRAVWARFGHHPPAELRVPAAVARVLGSAADGMAAALRLIGGGGDCGKDWTLSRGAVEDAVGVRYVDGARAREVLGYVPRVGLSEGVRRACDDYKRVLAEKEREEKRG